MSTYLGGLDSVCLDNDGPDGLYLRLTTDDGNDFTLRVTDQGALVDAVEGLRGHVLEGRRERRLFDAASAEERDRVTGKLSDAEFDALVDAGRWTAAAAEVWFDHGDHSRKAAKENS